MQNASQACLQSNRVEGTELFATAGASEVPKRESGRRAVARTRFRREIAGDERGTDQRTETEEDRVGGKPPSRIRTFL